jgi:hypothetical protein
MLEMKNLKIFLVLLCHLPCTLFALQAGDKLDSLITADGKQYLAVTIREINAEGISIIHESGVKKIAAKDLMPDMQKSLGLDPDAAEEASKKRIATENRELRDSAKQSADTLKDLKNTRRIKGVVLQVNQVEKSVIFEIREESSVITSPQDKAKRSEIITYLNKIKDKDGKYDARFVSLCDLRKLQAFEEFDDIFSHECRHAPDKPLFSYAGMPTYKCKNEHNLEIIYVFMQSLEDIVDDKEISELVVEQGVKSYQTPSGNLKSVRQFRSIKESNLKVLAEERARKKRHDQDRLSNGVTNQSVFVGKIVRVFQEEKAIVLNVKRTNVINRTLRGKESLGWPDNQYGFDVWIDVKNTQSFFDGKNVTMRVSKVGTKTYQSFSAKMEIDRTVSRFKEVDGPTEFKE